MNEYVVAKSNMLSSSRERGVAPSKINGNRSMSRGDLHYLFTYDSLSEVLRKVAQNSTAFHDATFRYRYLNAALRENRASAHDLHENHARTLQKTGARGTHQVNTRDLYRANARGTYKSILLTTNAMFRSRDRNTASREKCVRVPQSLENSVQTEFLDTATQETLRRFEPAQSSPTSTATHLNSHLAENLVEPFGPYEIP